MQADDRKAFQVAEIWVTPIPSPIIRMMFFGSFFFGASAIAVGAAAGAVEVEGAVAGPLMVSPGAGGQAVNRKQRQSREKMTFAFIGRRYGEGVRMVVTLWLGFLLLVRIFTAELFFSIQHSGVVCVR